MQKPLFVLMLCAIAGSHSLFAEQVSSDRAKEIAAKYVAETPMAPSTLRATGVETLNDNLYLVHFAPKGFAIVSRDDNAEPIIAYSLEGNINSYSMPENMQFMVDEAAKTVGYEAATGTKNAKWTQIDKGTVKRSRAAEPIEPLISVMWNQGDPYNTYCPGTGKNKALVGCVAVSMSQAMSVQQFPVKPMGQVTYAAAGYGQLSIDFDKENPYDWNAILKGSNNRDEVARLLYHAGMSVNMNYGVDGSGIPSSQVYRITNALKNNFGYPSVAYYARDTYSGNWNQLLLNELQAGRAIVYNAIDTKGGYGHSFNIDGFDGNDFFHVNWGWGGTGNTYFSINSLRDSQMNMNYDAMHYAVTGIGAPNSPLQSITLSDLVVESDTPVGSALCAVLVNGEMPTREMSVSITGEYNKQTGQYEDVPFEYKDGLLYLRNAISSEGSYYVRIVVNIIVDGKRLTLNQGYTMQVVAPQAIESRTSLAYDRQAKVFRLHSKYGANYSVKNAQGTVVASGTFDAQPNIEFSRDMLTPGTNTVEVSSNGKSKTLKIAL